MPIIKHVNAHVDETVEISWNFGFNKPTQFTRHTAPPVIDVKVRGNTLSAEDVREELATTEVQTPPTEQQALEPERSA